MKDTVRILPSLFVVAATLLMAPRECRAEDLLASKIFGTSTGELHGLAYDVSASRLYTIERGTVSADPKLRAYTLDGTLVSGPHELGDTEGSLTKMGLHFLRAGTSIGGEAVPAGTLSYLRGTAGGVVPDVHLYALDKTDGSVIESEVVGPDFDAGGLCTSPLNAGGKGLGYSTRLGLFLSTHSLSNCAGVAEFIGGAVTDFIAVSVPASGGAGDVKEHPSSGDLWVGNAPDSDSLSVFSKEGELLEEFDIVDADTLGAVGIARLAFDASGERLWLLSTVNGDVYQIDLPLLSSEPIPTLSQWGLLLLGLALGGTALRVLARRSRVRSA